MSIVVFLRNCDVVQIRRDLWIFAASATNIRVFLDFFGLLDFSRSSDSLKIFLVFDCFSIA